MMGTTGRKSVGGEVAERAGRLLLGSSLLALVAGLAAEPAHAQLARLRGAAAGVGAPNAAAIAQAAGIARGPSMDQSVARSAQYRDRVNNIRSIVTNARDAALAATRANPTDGLGANGLSPIAAIRQAIQLSQSADPGAQEQLQAVLQSVRSANDPTGKATWQGAGLPQQGNEDGRVLVSITQTEQRAVLTWDRMDVGANTTLRFSQKLGGVAQANWTVLNRVVDPEARPTTILGRLEADGSVFILNRNDVVFGATAQVKLSSLLASTLEIGNFSSSFNINNPTFTPLSIRQRNDSFLQNGAFSGITAGQQSPSFLLSPDFGVDQASIDQPPVLEGGVAVDPGAQITAGKGGFVVLAAPVVEQRGILKVEDGQIGLVGGRYVSATPASGAAGSPFPELRGFLLRVAHPTRSAFSVPTLALPDDGYVLNAGLVEALRGNITLITGQLGEVINNGLLYATTSVSRSGSIFLAGARVSLGGDDEEGLAGAIAIEPDQNGETIPQGSPEEPATFKTSVIRIGAPGETNAGTAEAGLSFQPGVVDFGQNSLIVAPSATVIVGRAAGQTADVNYGLPSSVTVGAGAVIDVGGMKDVEVDGARNFLTIDPVKRNELRDTPTYREVATGNGFTLNGQTLTVDIRRSGVRSDGVRWVGSPLLEAGSAASQISVTAAELMTKGGSVTFGTGIIGGAIDAATAPFVRVADSASIDISGGWVSFSEVNASSSRLVTADGRIVDIGDANPNDVFVAVANGFTAHQPRFGVADLFQTGANQGVRTEQAYTDGKDAGVFSVSAPAIGFEGDIFGNAYAGRLQIGYARHASQQSAFTADPRQVQRNASELPSGGFARLGSFWGESGVALGGNILLYQGAPSGQPVGLDTLRLNTDMLSDAGLSALLLQTSGSVTFSDGQSGGPAVVETGKSVLELADGGNLAVVAGRKISFGGDVHAPSGSISAETVELGTYIFSLDILTGIGSAFDSSDDLGGFAPGQALPSPFDIEVDGLLSTAGRWVNEALDGPGFATTQAWVNGGSIRLRVAPKVLAPLIENNQITEAVDLSGSLLIASQALLDVSAGGIARGNRTLVLTGNGGNISLINETTYAALVPTVRQTGGEGSIGKANQPINGTNQTVEFSPVDGGTVIQQLVPREQRARVEFELSSIRGFGFTGGGTFSLIAPNIAFGSDSSPGAVHIPLDFLQKTGFGTLSLRSLRSRIVDDVFANGASKPSAFLEVSRFVVREDETLDLTQATLPRFFGQAEVDGLFGLETGGSLFDVLTPGVAANSFDRLPAHLVLGGLTELEVENGGQIIGSPGASMQVASLYSAGDITLPGGRIAQIEDLPFQLADRFFAVRDVEDGGTGLAALLGAGQPGQFLESAANGAGLTDPNDANRLLTNVELFTRPDVERFVVFAGRNDLGVGIVLAEGSETDLSGVARIDPRAPFIRGQQLRTGVLLDGGTIETATPYSSSGNFLTLFDSSTFGTGRLQNTTGPNFFDIRAVRLGRTFELEADANLKLGGIADTLDVLVGQGQFALRSQWSNGGTLKVGAGGTIAGTVDAFGGADKASGGTLVWNRPSIAATGTSGVLGADTVMESGFDTLIAQGGLHVVGGPFTLSLDKALILSAPPADTDEPRTPDAFVRLSGDAGANATFEAPYIRFAGRSGNLPILTVNAGLLEPAGDAVLRFDAGSIGLDVAGALFIDRSVADVRFTSDADIRFIGVDDRPRISTALPTLDGEILGFGDISFHAHRIYATTGTGNLQRLLEQSRTGEAFDAVPFQISALVEGRISFTGDGLPVETPLSAGTYVRVQAKTIVQDGTLLAPLGVLELGSTGNATLLGRPAGGNDLRTVATESVTLGANSLTGVSGIGANIPYGTTTDLIEYFFRPTTALPITTLPSGEVRLAGETITIADGASVDGRGGGDVFAFEFVSGVGGSRDLLDRLNTDRFSSNAYDSETGAGLQYADGRQVFALLPKAKLGNLALHDPIYSADYGEAGPVDLTGAAVARSVILDAAPGIEAGEYLLLPGHYALLPDAIRIVESPDLAAPADGATFTLLDGSTIVGGRFGTAGTGQEDSVRRAFTIMSQETVLRYSRLDVTPGTKSVVDAATKAGRVAPRIPLDAARVVLSPSKALQSAGLFDMVAAAGGRDAQFDLAVSSVTIGDALVSGFLITTDTLASFGSDISLFIGGQRRERVDGKTVLDISASNIVIGSGTELVLPELLLAVGGREPWSLPTQASILIAEGASLRGEGVLDDTRADSYVIESSASGAQGGPVQTGVGAVVRVSSGPERLVVREGATAAANSQRPALLRVEEASLSGNAVLLETSRTLTIVPGASIAADFIALGADQLRLNSPTIPPELLAQLSLADRVTLMSTLPINVGAASLTFNDLVLNTPGLFLLPGGLPADPVASISAKSLVIENQFADRSPCGGTGNDSCGSAGGSLLLDVVDLTFRNGGIGTFGFDKQVTIRARNGIFAEGKASFDTGIAALTIDTPFIVDRAASKDAAFGKARPDLTLLTTNSVTITSAAGVVADSTAARAPGARIAIGERDRQVAAISITDSLIRATAGSVELFAEGDILLRPVDPTLAAGGARLAAPGYAKTFGDKADAVSVSAGGGNVTLVSSAGKILLPSTSTIITDTGTGSAGTLTVSAAQGGAILQSVLNPNVTGARDASLQLDAGPEAFDFAGFVTTYGPRFGGNIAIRTGSGDLRLEAGQEILLDSLSLVADGGEVFVAGKVDASGADRSTEAFKKLAPDAQRRARIDGGDIELFGSAGVTLAGSGARLVSRTYGYADTDTRAAKGGDVTLGIGTGNAVLTIGDGALIDVGAKRTEGQAPDALEYRLVKFDVIDPSSLGKTIAYRLAEPDRGGDVTLRAPVRGAQLDSVAISIETPAAIGGARDVTVEAYLRYDLDSLVTDPTVRGISLADGANPGQKIVELDVADGYGTADYARNLLAGDFTTAGGLPSVSRFVRNFEVSASDGTTSFADYRLRPGVELASANDIALVSNWNLGAATIDQDRARQDGLLVPIRQLNGGTLNDGSGDAYLALLPGQEANLLQNYADFTYRVGTDGTNAGGEAPVVTIRSEGHVNIKGSISDGFFLFRDKTDPFYMSYQLFGEDREVLPAGVFSCSTADPGTCDNVQPWIDLVRAKNNPLNGAEQVDPSATALINLQTIAAGRDLTPAVPAPFSQRGNSAAALGGVDWDGAPTNGDPFGAAELFPLIDNGTKAIRSSGLRLTAGNDLTSADPSATARGRDADVVVEGEKTYEVRSRVGRGIFAGTNGRDPVTGLAVGPFALDLRARMSVNATVVDNPIASADSDFLQNLLQLDANGELAIDEAAANDYYTTLRWGTNPRARSLADAAFGADGQGGFFQLPTLDDIDGYEQIADLDAERFGIALGTPGFRSGVAARLSDVLAFLDRYGTAFVEAGLSPQFDSLTPPTLPQTINLATHRFARVGTIVRSGDGGIAIAAASDVTLLRTAEIVYRSEGTSDPFASTDRLQVGGTAVYTAGTRIPTVPIRAATPDGQVSFEMSWDREVAQFAAVADDAYIPSAKGHFFNAPVMASGGGSISIDAGDNVTGRSDQWSEKFLGNGQGYALQTRGRPATPVVQLSTFGVPRVSGSDMREKLALIGDGTSLWRLGNVGQNSYTAIEPNLFRSGVAALAGGNIDIDAGGAATQLTIVIESSIVTSSPRSGGASPLSGSGAPVLASFGNGSLSLNTGDDIVGGEIDVASGVARIVSGDDVIPTEIEVRAGRPLPFTQGLRVRVANASVEIIARDEVDFTGITALSPLRGGNFAGFGTYGQQAGLMVTAGGGISFANIRADQNVLFQDDSDSGNQGLVFAPTLELAALGGSVLWPLIDNPVLRVTRPVMLYPSPEAALRLFSTGDLDGFVLAMSDSEASLLPGPLSAYERNPDTSRLLPAVRGLNFGFPGKLAFTSDVQLRSYHAAVPVHAGNSEPVRVQVDGSITDAVIVVPKQARIGAGLDLVDVYFTGQNVANSDVTRIVAGRDIYGSVAVSTINQTRLPYVRSGNFVVGGPGEMVVEAGRDLGPLLTSVTYGGQSYSGGIRTVGNEYNPYLPEEGADLTVQFGVASGADYEALRDTYLDPANFAQLDGDLFVQTADVLGNLSPDRTKQVYAPVLGAWLQENAPEAFAEIFGNAFPDASPGDPAFAAAAYGQSAALYGQFITLPTLLQRRFLANDLLFGELTAPAIPTGPSYLQYVRGYRAIAKLFPTSLGYTDNLATYDVDPATITDVNPLGVPTRRLDANGQPVVADARQTGDADLRLSTIQTTRGGSVTILAPGGNLIAGSVVRTSDQTARRAGINRAALEYPRGQTALNPAVSIAAIPPGFEGILTLGGGAIRGFTDRDVRLNQSRIFSYGDGPITLWSSNGDLNAGQGPRSASNFPPITVRINPDGQALVDSIGSVSGAGIGAFKRAPTDPASPVILLAPVGEVDAGDAGVRASGDVFVAAARVANADNFKAGGDISGVPTGLPQGATAPAGAGSETAAQVAQAAGAASQNDGRSTILVEVLGYADKCANPETADESCPKEQAN